jgi:hypothetical protein
MKRVNAEKVVIKKIKKFQVVLFFWGLDNVGKARRKKDVNKPR